MNCYRFKKNMQDLYEGNIDSEIENEMIKHMETCSTCKNEYEDTKFITESLRKDASSIVFTDKQKKEIKGEILKAPLKKHRDLQRVLKSLTYAAAIFMFITTGIYFAGGVNINIGHSENSNTSLLLQLDKLEGDNRQLIAENEQLKSQINEMSKYIKDLESGKYRSWMMINPNIDEAIIEGRILNVDNEGKKIRLNIYKDDNTPNIDPYISIPDGIMISRVPEGDGENVTSMVSGNINDFKTGDHVTIHYMGKLKAARAVIIYQKGL